MPSQRHDAQIAALDKGTPGRGVGRRVLIAFVAIPVGILAVAYVDSTAHSIPVPIDGTATDVRVELTENTPSAQRRTVTVRLNDGTSVRCVSSAAVVGDRVTLLARSSRLFGRRVIQC